MLSASPRNSSVSSRTERRNGNRDSVSTTTSTLTLGGSESVPGIMKILKSVPIDKDYETSQFKLCLFFDIITFLGANQNGTSVSHNGQDRASTNSSGISSLKSQIAKSFRLSSSSTSVTSNNASKSPPDNNVEQATECSVKENSNS